MNDENRIPLNEETLGHVSGGSADIANWLEKKRAASLCPMKSCSGLLMDVLEVTKTQALVNLHCPKCNFTWRRAYQRD